MEQSNKDSTSAAKTASSGRRILIVDDDEVFRQALKEILEQAGHEVISAADGRVAESIIGVSKFDLIITDIKMPETNGIELTHFIRRTSKIPIILMTGYPEVAEKEDALEIGADCFLSKPFKREELFEAIEHCLPSERIRIAVDHDMPQRDRDEDFCKISLEDFIHGKDMRSDIFIRLGAGRYIKITHANETIPADRLQKYKEKKIKFLYMRKDDFKKYVGFNLNIAKALKSTTKIDKPRKMRLLKHTTEVIMEQLFLEGVSEESFENAKIVTETAVSVFADDKDTLNLLALLNSHTDYLYGHSLGVSIYAVMIARELHWTSPANIFKVSMGGLMHDIGKKEIDRKILDKSRKDMTREEIKIYETHAIRGLEILGKVQTIPSDVLQIVAQHHEIVLGQGYPAGLKKERIHPLARLVAVADEFCYLVVKNPESSGMKPEEALQRMREAFIDKLDPGPFSALLRVFSIDTKPVEKRKTGFI